MAAIVFALLSAALYGSADFLGGLASRRSAVMPVMIFSQLAGLLTLLLVLPCLPAATAARADFAWGAVAGGALGIGLMLLYQGLATGKMSVVAPVTAVLAVVMSAAACMVIGDRLSVGAFAGVVLAMMAITLISQDGTREKAKAGHGWGTRTRPRCRTFGRRPDRRVFRCTQADQSRLRPITTRCGAAGRAGCPRCRRPLAAAVVAHRARRGMADRRRRRARHLRERALPPGHAPGHADYRRDIDVALPREHDPSRALGSRRTPPADSNRWAGVRRARRCAPRRGLDSHHADPAIFLPLWSMLSNHALRRHRVKPDCQFLRQHDRVCRRIRTCMIVIKRKGLFHPRRAGGSFDPLRVLFHFFARVQVIVALLGLLRIPPRFGVAAMGAKVKYVADRFGLLADRSSKLRLVDQNPTSSMLP